MRLDISVKKIRAFYSGRKGEMRDKEKERERKRKRERETEKIRKR